MIQWGAMRKYVDAMVVTIVLVTVAALVAKFTLPLVALVLKAWKFREMTRRDVIQSCCSARTKGVRDFTLFATEEYARPRW